MVLFCWVVGFFWDPVEIKDASLKSYLELQVLTFILSADNTNITVSYSKDLSNLFVSSEDSYHIASI